MLNIYQKWENHVTIITKFWTENKLSKGLSNQELDRICLEYTNLLMGSSKLTKSLKKKTFDFDVKATEGKISRRTEKRCKKEN